MNQQHTFGRLAGRRLVTTPDGRRSVVGSVVPQLEIPLSHNGAGWGEDDAGPTLSQAQPEPSTEQIFAMSVRVSRRPAHAYPWIGLTSSVSAWMAPMPCAAASAPAMVV
jgi:hypothetical protein